MKELSLLIKEIAIALIVVIASCNLAHSEQTRVLKQTDTARYVAIAQSTASGCPYVFIADFGLPQQAKRFFVIDMKSRKIIKAGLCCNGRTDAAGRVMYSNAANSHCSSKGIYQLAERYTGTFGVAYKLDGLSTTNSNARKRNVVLHSHECVPNVEDGSFNCQSFGCPTLNPAFFKALDALIQSTKRPLRLVVL